MSSFVINKEEYIKAAGAVAGLAQEYKVWLYDYESERNSTPEDYYRHFVECFDMNAISVAEQYHDETVETDSRKYMDVFNEYRRKAQYISVEPQKRRELVYELTSFFNSSIYHTEKDAYKFKMQMYYSRIIAALVNDVLALGYEAQSWGAFEI